MQRHPTPVLLPGKSHGQRSLAGYSPWGHKESDMTEHACMCSRGMMSSKSSLSVGPASCMKFNKYTFCLTEDLWTKKTEYFPSTHPTHHSEPSGLLQTFPLKSREVGATQQSTEILKPNRVYVVNALIRAQSDCLECTQSGSWLLLGLPETLPPKTAQVSKFHRSLSVRSPSCSSSL